MKEFSLEEHLKNPERKVVTREGRPVRIICTDFNNINYPIIIEVKGLDVPLPATREGRHISLSVEERFDLFFAPEKHTDYINLYRNEFGYFLGGGEYSTEEEAKRVAARAVDTYITTIKAEWEE